MDIDYGVVPQLAQEKLAFHAAVVEQSYQLKLASAFCFEYQEAVPCSDTTDRLLGLVVDNKTDQQMAAVDPGWDSEVALDMADVPASEQAPDRVDQQLRLESGIFDFHVAVTQA